MNKQELIKHFEEMEYVSVSQMGKKAFIDLIEQLDEPQKPAIPQFVADWIERSKQENRNLRNALNNGGEKMRLWFLDQENYDLFARAWLDGYTVEKEKRYTVKMTATKQPLFYNNLDERLFFSLGELATQFTRKQLEDAGFGWVFNSPLFEVVEVEG